MKRSLQNLSLVIIEDDAAIVKHLHEILSFSFKNITVFSNGCDALEYIKTNKPDIILSDIKLPCLEGLELIKEIKNSSYSPFIAIMSAFSDKKYLLDALDNQVDVYLIKPIDVDKLFVKLEQKFTSLNTTLQEKLSKREYEVFLELAKGLKPAQIAQHLHIKPKTISTYRERIFEKMGFSSNADLIAYALKNDIT